MIRIAGQILFAALLPLSAVAADQHQHVLQSDSVQWKPAPAAFPKGAEIALLQGDPAKEGQYMIRLKVPAGYRIAPHTHPNDENVTVLSGTFGIGMGDKLDESKAELVKAGGFAQAAKGMVHFAVFPEPTIIQLHGIGPGGINYVDPADDPRKTN